MLIAQSTSQDSWELLPYKCPLNPIHAAVLRTGKVFFIAGSGNNQKNVNETHGSAVWDVDAGTFYRPVTPLDAVGFPIDLFCAGHSFLPDGRLMVAGGTKQYNPFLGLSAALIFDPIGEQWTTVASMNAGRWYPTVVTLGDGRVLALSGLDENRRIDTYPEIYSAAKRSWTFFTQPTSVLPMYAHLFVLQDGRLFYSGACFGGNNGVLPRLLTLPIDRTQRIAERLVSGLQNDSYCDQAASVLLPPAQDQKVMVIGGGNLLSGQTTNRVNIVDLKLPNPTYRPAASLNFPRMHHNAVLLPDRTVFVCNGSQMHEEGDQATRTAEIYNPATNTWTVAATASVTRLYHSVALLLPDGRVITAGGNPHPNIVELQLEIYSPAYMSRQRPVIDRVPQTLSYGSIVKIQTPQARNIKWVSLIKPMATTHCLDTDQRLVDVPIKLKTDTYLVGTVTGNQNIAPPGWYMLFITDEDGVPSVAKWIQLM